MALACPSLCTKITKRTKTTSVATFLTIHAQNHEGYAWNNGTWKSIQSAQEHQVPVCFCPHYIASHYLEHYSSTRLSLPSRTHIPPLGRMAAPNKARINGHLIFSRVCACVTSADSPGVWPRTRSASASFISVYNCASVCAEKQCATCAPPPCPQPADALKVKTNTRRKGLSTMQSYQSQPRLVAVLWTWKGYKKIWTIGQSVIPWHQHKHQKWTYCGMKWWQ